VYSATLQAMADHSPHKPGVKNIADLAGTHRSYLYRNWPRTNELITEALTYHLRLLLAHALDPSETITSRLPPLCVLSSQLATCTRLAQNHPLLRTLQSRHPDVLLQAISAPRDHPLRILATNWLHGCLNSYFLATAPATSPRHGIHPRTSRYTELLLSTLTPFVLAPCALPESPPDRTVRSFTHALLGNSPDCDTCTVGAVDKCLDTSGDDRGPFAR
jgi:AcrR family transcriptional regulator